MNIRGLKKLSLIDYPKKLACVVFIGNCNFMCPYCHNPFLVVDPESQPLITESKLYSFLNSRIGKLDSVVISGGEPTLEDNILKLCYEIKKRGFLIKLDTNGSRPKIIKQLWENKYLDFVGLDYKSTKSKYKLLTNSKEDKVYDSLIETISYIIFEKIDFDIRTTVHKALLSKNDLFKIREELYDLGVKNWILQQFNSVDVMDETLNNIPTFKDEELSYIAGKLHNTRIRGLKYLKNSRF
jgi:pyruvate formate lyase activating enzyme